jgi:hypothetical protein
MRRPPSSGIPSPFAPREEPPARPAEPDRRREPPAIAIVPRAPEPDERERPEDDAFVIRPRISAKQAAELASPGN